MACHNADPYVGEAIKSVVDQTFDDLELIFVDDKSSDDSLTVAESLAQSDKRIRVFSSRTNLGASAARNLAIEKAKGEWLAILDADDVYLNTKLERQVQLIDSASPDIVLVGTDSYEIDKSGVRHAKQSYPVSGQDLVKALTRRKRFPPHSSIMYRTSVIRSLGGFNVRFSRAEDYDLQLRIIGHGQMASISEPLIEYRFHDTNISKSTTGIGQLTFSVSAGICHSLRSNRNQDPSQSGSEREWREFLTWVEEQLRTLHYYDYKRVKTAAKASFSNNPKKLLRYTNFGFELMRTKHLGRFISERGFGSRVYRHLAKRWESIGR